MNYKLFIANNNRAENDRLSPIAYATSLEGILINARVFELEMNITRWAQEPKSPNAQVLIQAPNGEMFEYCSY